MKAQVQTNESVMDREVRKLLGRGFFSTYFQPIISTGALSAKGYEALLRGPVGSVFQEPGRLFGSGSALSSKIKTELDIACIGSAVRTARHLPESGLIFLNILADTLQKLARDIDVFVSLLKSLGIRPDRVVLEVSESTGFEDSNRLMKVLAVFRRAGIRFALDDIGIRSPYLHHILYLEPEYLKLDRAFIVGVDSDVRKQSLVRGVCYMARQVDAELIAEGVESVAEFECLKDLGVPNVQGYLFGRPVPSESCAVSQEPKATGQVTLMNMMMGLAH